MARAFILIRYPGEDLQGLEVLHGMAEGVDFAKDTGTIIESVQVVFGAADYGIVLWAPMWGSMFQGITELRRALNATLQGKGAELHVLTSSILGIDRSELKNPLTEVEGQFVRLLKSSPAEPGAETQPRQEDRELIGRAVLNEYVRERMRSLRPIARAIWGPEPEASKAAQLLRAIDEFLS